MKRSQHYGFIWKIVVVAIGYSVVLPPGWAQGERTKAVPSELALNVSSRTREFRKEQSKPISL